VGVIPTLARLVLVMETCLDRSEPEINLQVLYGSYSLPADQSCRVAEVKSEAPARG